MSFVTLGKRLNRRRITALIGIAVAAILVWGIQIFPAVAATSLLPSCAENGDCSLCDVVGLFINFAALITEWLGILAVLMFIIGGVFIIIAAGNAERAKKGRQILIGTVIGSVLVMSGWLIINFALAALLNADPSTVEIFPTSTSSGGVTTGGKTWYELACEPVVVDCTTAADGTSCTKATNDSNSVCSSKLCISYCDYLSVKGTYSSTTCASNAASCPSGDVVIEDYCPSTSVGDSQVCCAVPN